MEQERSTPAASNSDPALPNPQAKVMLHMPIDVRSISLVVIATILSLYALQWAKDVIVPILAGLIVSYALNPVVKRMERLRIPRPVGATLLLSLILGLLGWGAASLADQADALVDTVPAVTERLRELSNRMTGRTSTLQRVTRAADDLSAVAADPSSSASASASASTAAVGASAPRAAASSAAAGASSTAPSRQNGAGPAHPKPASPAAPAFDMRSYLVTGTLGVASLLAQIAVIFFIALFVMASGDSFRRKMVKLAGNTLSQKKVTVETLDEITGQIQRYLLVQLGVSVVVGVLTGLAFMALGLHNAAVWGVAAGITNLVPYVGAIALSGAAAVVGLVQFGTVEMGLGLAAASFFIHTVVGNVLTPWWTGRASKMSSLAVFITVLVFGWLWGVWGLLLGVPILLVAKAICDRVEDLKPIGELLS